MFKSPYKLCFLALLTTSPLFVLGDPNFYSHRLLTELWNLGHLFFFALFAFLLDHYWCSQQRSKLFRITATLLILVCIAFTTELIQLGLPDRFFSWMDLTKDISGGVIILLWLIGHNTERTQSVFLRVIALFCLGLNLIPLLNISIDTYHSHTDFPLLAGFEHITELSRWDGGAGLTIDSQIHLGGNSSGKIAFSTEQYSGIFLHHFPRNWSNRSGLAFSVFNPGQVIQLHYRVHDNLHSGDSQGFSNRFNGSSLLSHGWNEIVIPMVDILHGPLDRTMNVDKIQCFGIFVVQQKNKRTLYIDDLHLL